MPSIARTLLGLAEERGQSPSRLCRGLGFRHGDLRSPELLLSYQQMRALILRVQDALGGSALGLAAGARQTPVSWGLPGLAMLTCETFGEAIAYGLQHQDEAGAMLDHVFEDDGRVMCFEVLPRVRDVAIEAFLVEDALGGVLSVGRHLVGATLRPLRVEFGFERTGAVGPYERFYRCPVAFGRGRHRLVFASSWLSARLPAYDPMTSGFVRQQLAPLLARAAVRHDLVESVARRIRFDAHERPRQADLARQANLSERTLRRRLGSLSTGYRRLRDETLFEKAGELLRDGDLRIADVAHHLGYADAGAFRRAFKRWSGEVPAVYRDRHRARRDPA